MGVETSSSVKARPASGAMSAGPSEALVDGRQCRARPPDRLDRASCGVASTCSTTASGPPHISSRSTTVESWRT